MSLWSTSVCQAVAAVHSVVRRLHRGLTQRHSHNNIKHHSISSNIQFRLSTKASLNIFGLFISVWGGFPSNIGSHAELIHCAMHSTTIFVPQYFETKQVFILCGAVELAGYCTFCMLATIKRYLVFCRIKIIISITYYYHYYS